MSASAAQESIPALEREIFLDTNAVSFLEEAVAIGYDPRTDDPVLAAERIACFRIYLWAPGVHVSETAVRESERIRDVRLRAARDRFVGLHLGESEVWDEIRGPIEARVEQLLSLHPQEGDCRIVAEAEVMGGTDLATFDERLRRTLGDVARVRLLPPSALWADLAVARGTLPRLAPAPGNPLAHAPWWRWE